MVFSSLVFLYLFLPVVLISYYIFPKYLKNTFLLGASLFFYAWGEPKLVILMLVSIVINYFIGLAIHNSGSLSRKKAWVASAVAANLLILGYYKYAGFFISVIEDIFKVEIEWEAVPLPIGISFYTFQAMSYIIDVYRKDAKAQRNIINVALYISLFPQLVAGPIVRFQSIADQIKSRIISSKKIAEGTKRFIQGLSKKVLIANPLGEIADQIFETSAGDLTTATAWIGILAYSLQIYFDFSGYSDMAIGLGKFFGFEFEENFRYPYIAQNVTEFWRRWHISLSTWFKDYVYIPLGGNRVKTWMVYRNLLIVWTITGFWHGASWTFMAWGFYYGVLICLEKWFLADLLKRIPRFFRHIYLLLIVMIGWVFFRADDFSYAFQYIQTMFNINTDLFMDHTTILILLENNLYLIIGLILASGFYPKLVLFTKKWKETSLLKEGILGVSSSIYYLFLILIVTMFLVNDSYNPFIYFRF